MYVLSLVGYHLIVMTTMHVLFIIRVKNLTVDFFPKCTPLFLQRTCYIQTYYQQIQQIPKNVAKSYPVIGDVNSQCVVKVIHNLHKFLTLEKKSLPRCEQSLFSTILDGSNNIICSEFKCHVYMVA